MLYDYRIYLLFILTSATVADLFLLLLFISFWELVELTFSPNFPNARALRVAARSTGLAGTESAPLATTSAVYLATFLPPPRGGQ